MSGATAAWDRSRNWSRRRPRQDPRRPTDKADLHAGLNRTLMAEGASPDAWTRLFDDPDFFQLAEDTLADRGRDTEEARAVYRVHREPAMTEHLIDDSANQ